MNSTANSGVEALPVLEVPEANAGGYPSNSSSRHDCACACPSYGAHLRGKGIRVAYTNSTNGQDATKQKKWDRELSRYRDLTGQGIEPQGTTHSDMDRAEKAANR